MTELSCSWCGELKKEVQLDGRRARVHFCNSCTELSCPWCGKSVKEFQLDEEQTRIHLCDSCLGVFAVIDPDKGCGGCIYRNDCQTIPMLREAGCVITEMLNKEVAASCSRFREG